MKRVLALILTMVVGLGLLTACAPDQDTCDHNWSEWTVVTEATCTVDGSEKRTCSICKKEETRPITAAHQWGEWKIVEPATHETPGLKERECSVDHEKQQEEIPAYGGEHEYKLDKTIEGDCVTKTVYEYKCSVCGDIRKEEGNIVPDKHVGTKYDCGLHCEFCGKDMDHAATTCGVEGHFKCDGLDHTQCAIEKASNMKLTAIDDGKAWRLDGFTSAGDRTEVFVPAFVDNKPVTEIGPAVFEGIKDENDDTAVIEWLNSVTYIYIPDTVKTLGEYFAYDMDALETVRLPKSVENWNQHTFFTVPSLKTLNIPRGTVSLKGNVGDGSNDPVAYALESITLPVTFTDLNCLKLFFRDSKVSAINYEGSEEFWAALLAKVTDSEFKAKLEEITPVYNYNYNTLYAAETADMQVRLAGFAFEAVEGGYAITGCTGTVGETLTIPETLLGKPVVALANNALSGEPYENDAEGANSNPLSKVKTIVFEAKLTSIGDYNFYGMDALLEVVLPDTVTYVGSQCFYNCKNLTKVVIPDGATVDMSRAPFANCPALVEIELPATLKNQSAEGAFANANEALAITFGGNSNLWYYLTSAASANLAKATFTYNGGKTIEQDGNGAEFILNEDGESYTLVGFYDTVKAGEPLAPVGAYTVPTEFNGKPITGIGAAVFNAKAYANEEIANWMKTMGALIIGVMTPTGNEAAPFTYSDNNVKHIGSHNFVAMESVAQLRVPTEIDDTIMVGCYIDIIGANFIRVPRGVETMTDCFQWSNAFFNGVAARWLVLPSSIKEFNGNSWTGKANGFGVVMDCANADAGAEFEKVIDASHCTRSDWEGAVVPFFKTFSGAGLVVGEGGAFNYDLFLTLGF